MPSGFIDILDPSEGEIRDAANRELQEEVGMKSDELVKITTSYISNQLTMKMHIFLGRKLSPSKLRGDEHEYLEVEKLPFDEAFSLIRDTQIPTSQTLLAFSMVKDYLNSH